MHTLDRWRGIRVCARKGLCATRRAIRCGSSASRVLKKLVCELISAMSHRTERANESRYRRRMRRICYVFLSSSTLQTDSSRRQQLRDANKIVGGRRQDKEPLDQSTAAMAGFAQAADGLDPSERFFDPLAADRAETIAGMPGRAGIDRRTAVGVILRDVGGAAAFATAGDELGRVIVLVAAHRAARLGFVLDHCKGGGALRRAVGFRHPCIDEE